MKANLVVDESIYIMNCRIKPSGLGLYWRVYDASALEKLIKKERIIFTTLQSKYYTGRVSIFKGDGDDFITISLADKDFQTELKRFERKTLFTTICIVAVASTLFISGTNAIAWILSTL